ncbi:glycosyltransferase [Candidatus Woesearchaeota archaeon]|nr:glycosyltransferase [Candidatus Woesearchaeota archaeon]
MFKKSISVVIPAYNEEELIEKTTLDLKKYLSSLKLKNLISSYEIIISVNGSKDRTEEFSRNLSKKYNNIKCIVTRKKGMGLALRNGIKASSKDLITFIAADGEALTDFIERAILTLNHYDFISGSRYLVKNQVKGSSFLRLFLSMGFAFFIKIFFSTRFSEVGTVKLFERKWAQRIIDKCKRNDASWQVEILYYALTSGLKIKEIPVYIKIKKEGRKSKVKILREIYYFLMTTLKFSLALRLNQFKKLLRKF